MIQLISLTGIFTFLPFIKKNKTKQNNPKNPPKNKTTQPKQQNQNQKKNPKHPTKTNLLAGIYF